jgi:hypothetical protein
MISIADTMPELVLANKMQRKQMTEPLMGRLAKNAEELPIAIGQAIADARNSMRLQLDELCVPTFRAVDFAGIRVMV